MTFGGVKTLCADIKANIKKVIIGKDFEIDLLLTALLSGGHALIEDVPGTGKTLLAKTLAKSLDLAFTRVQFTPDLMPQELTGGDFYNPKTGEFVFKRGALFTNVLLADEINRATPRTQAGLLEAMEERQITSDGRTFALDAPFFVIATQNPVETHGTYPLPEAQTDRFLIKLGLGYPTFAENAAMLARFKNGDPTETIAPVANKAAVSEAQNAAKNVFAHDDILNYITALTFKTRENEKVSRGVSPRGSICLMRLAQSYAALNGREFVTPDDVIALLPYCFGHRISAGYSLADANVSAVVDDALSAVPVPTEDWKKRL